MSSDMGGTSHDPVKRAEGEAGKGKTRGGGELRRAWGGVTVWGGGGPPPDVGCF